MRVVIDTNVIISRFLSPHGTPASILACWEHGLFELIVTDAILAEYLRVLSYDRLRAHHGMTPDEIAQVVEGFRSFGALVEPPETITTIIDDPSDNRFLEAAVAGHSDYIVSGDPHLLRVGEYRGIQILQPAAFLAMLRETSDQE